MSANEYRAMSFNIRYPSQNDGRNAWVNRTDRVVHHILDAEPLVFGVQEAWIEQLHDLDSRLPDYRWVGSGRDDGAEEGEFTAIFFRTGEVELTSHQVSWFAPQSFPGAVGWDAVFPRTMTLGEFLLPEENRPFVFGNVHLDHKGARARTESAKQIRHTVRRLHHLPVIIAGDFNMEPHSMEYREVDGVYATDHFPFYINFSFSPGDGEPGLNKVLSWRIHG